MSCIDKDEATRTVSELSVLLHKIEQSNNYIIFIREEDKIAIENAVKLLKQIVK